MDYEPKPIEEIVEHSKKIKNEFLEKYLEENKDYEYKITIEEKDYSIKLKDIVNFITLNDNDFFAANIMYSPSKEIPVEHFKYAVLSFFKEKFSDLDINFGEIIERRLDQISRDDQIKLINQVYKTNDPNLPFVSVNQKLKEAILKDMPNYHGYKIFEPLYIYIKMCKLLTYDDEFYAVDQKGPIAELHQDIFHISEITPENNKIVCYEFASIFEAMLKEIGIPSELIKSNNDYDTYGNNHTAVKFKVGGYLLTVDSTTSILAGDLFAAKLNLGLSGITCLSGYNPKNVFDYIDMVYEDIHKTEPNTIPKPQSIDDILEEYRNYTEKMCDVSLKDKIDILINKTNSVNLKGIDCLAYLLYLKKRIFQGEHKNNISISLIRDNTSGKATARAILQIKGIDDEHKEHINYYSYLPNQKLIPISIEELQLMFDNNDLSYIQDSDINTINGIKVR